MMLLAEPHKKYPAFQTTLPVAAAEKVSNANLQQDKKSSKIPGTITDW